MKKSNSRKKRNTNLKLFYLIVAALLLVLDGIASNTSSAFADAENNVENIQLYQKAKTMRAPRISFAEQQGAKILATPDGKSFYVLWFPETSKTPSSFPVIVTLHGHASWAFDDFYVWQPYAKEHGYGIIALQWWFGGGEEASDYYTPNEIYKIFSTILQKNKIKPGRVLFHGFSRGAANTYAITALDRQSGNNYFGLTIANAGGAEDDFPLNKDITQGKFGDAPFKGTHWILFCGGKEAYSSRSGCPAMEKTQKWIEQLGGKIDFFIKDKNADHGGFHKNSENVEKAMDMSDTLLKP